MTTFAHGDRVAFTEDAHEELTGCAGKIRSFNDRWSGFTFKWVDITHGPSAGYSTIVPHAHMFHID